MDTYSVAIVSDELKQIERFITAIHLQVQLPGTSWISAVDDGKEKKRLER